MAKRDASSHVSTEHLQKDLRARAVKGGAWLAVAQGARAVIELGGTLLLARLLTPADFGIAGMAIAITGFVELFRDMGLTAAVIQKGDITEEQINSLFWVNLAVGAALMLLTLSSAPLIAWFYGEPRLVEVVLWLSLSMLFGGATVQHQALLRRQMRFRALMVVDVLVAFLGATCACAYAASEGDYFALVVRVLARSAATMGVVWLLCSWRPSRPRMRGVSDLLRFGSHVASFQVLNYLERNVDNALIGRFTGATALGLYQKAYELLRMPLAQISTPVGSIATPTLSRLQDQPERYRRAYLSMLEKVLLLIVPFSPVLFLCADWIIVTLLGPQWLDAVPIFQALSVTLLLKPLAQSCGWLFVTQGRSREMLRCGVIALVLALASFAVGLPYGALGVAIAYAATDLFVRIPILLWLSGRSGPVTLRDLVGVMMPFLTAASVVAGAIVALRTRAPEVHPLIGLLLATPLSACAAALGLSVLPSGRAVLGRAWTMVREVSRRQASSRT